MKGETMQIGSSFKNCLKVVLVGLKNHYIFEDAYFLVFLKKIFKVNFTIWV